MNNWLQYNKFLSCFIVGIVFGSFAFAQEFKNVVINEAKDLDRLKISEKIPLFEKSSLIKLGEITASTEYNYLHDSSSAGLNGIRGVYTTNVSLNATISNLPISLGFKGSNGIYNTAHSPLQDFYRINFDHQAYITSLQKRITDKISPDKITSSITQRINNIRSDYEKKLKRELDDIQKEYADKYSQSLSLPEDANSLSVNDLSALKKKILTDSVTQRYQESTIRYQELLKSGSFSDSSKALSKRVAEADIERYEKLEKVYSKILNSKKEFEENKIVTELRSHLPLTPESYNTFLSNPANMEQVLKEHADINGLERFFANVTKLDIGQNAVSTGDFSMQNVINSGVHGEYQNQKMSIGVIAGKNNNYNQWLQQGLSSTVTNEYASVKGFEFGTGSSSSVQQSVSLNVFDLNGSKMMQQGDVVNMRLPDYLPAAKHNEAVITYHSAFPVNENNQISFDVSKSFGAFQNNINDNSEVTKGKSTRDVFSGKGKSNWGGQIRYEGEVLETNINVFIKKVGLGYSNTGNTSLRRGESEIGLAVGRKFLEEKLSFKYSTDYRKQQFDPDNNYYYTTFSNKVQTGYRFKKNNKINISYQNSSYHSCLMATNVNGGSSSLLQLDGSYYIYANKKKIFNNDVLNYQSQSIPTLDSGCYKNSSVMWMHNSSIVIGKSNLLLVAILLNKAKSNEYLFNTSMYNTEVSFSYSLFGNVRLTSGSGFYANSGWNDQLGVKQSVSTKLFDKLNIDVDAGYRKAIRTIRTEWANQVYMTAGVKYEL